MINKKQRYTLLIGSFLLVSSLFILIPMGMGWKGMSSSTIDTVPMALSVPTAKENGNFNFTNETKVVSYSLKVEIGSGSVGKQINVTVHNKNGTRLLVQIMRAVNYKGDFEHKMFTNVFTDTNIGGSSPYSPTNSSFIITFLSTDEIFITISLAGQRATPQVPYEDLGGYIEIKETGTYLTTKLASDVSDFGVINLTEIKKNGFFVQEFSVSETGYYLFKTNASQSPDYAFMVLMKGGYYGVSAPVLGTYQNVGGNNIASSAGKYPYTTVMYLESGKPYVMYIGGNSLGNIEYLSFSKIKPVTGAIGDTPVDIDYSKSTDYTVTQLGESTWEMYVTYSGVQFDQLYDISLTSPAYPWGAACMGLFSLDNSFYAGTSSSGQFLVIENKYLDIKINDQSMDKIHTQLVMERDASPTEWDNNTLIPKWSSNGLTKFEMEHQFLQVRIYNETLISGLPIVKVGVKQNAAGVKSLPTGEVSGQSGYYAGELTFNNAGGEDSQGIYKISGKKGQEFQLSALSCGSLPLLSGNTEFSFNFYSDTTLMGWWDIGYYNINPITITNTSYIFSVLDPISRVYETGLFSDTVYMIFTGEYDTTNFGSNTTSISIKYTFENFKKSGEKFVYSRDNYLQCFDLDLGTSGIATLSLIHGMDSIGATVNIASPNSLEFIFGTGGIGATTAGTPYAMKKGGAMYGYLQVSSVAVPLGSVIELEINAVGSFSNFSTYIPYLIGGVIGIAIGAIVVFLMKRH